MVVLVTYKGLQVLSIDDPTGDAGNALQDNFKFLADSLFSINTKTGDYPVVTSDFTILVDTSSNDVTITLPLATDFSGRVFNIKLIEDSNVGDIALSGSDELDGDTANLALTLHETVTVQSDGTNWWII